VYTVHFVPCTAVIENTRENAKFMSQPDSTRPEQENKFQSATSIEVFVQLEQRPRVIDKGPKSRLLESIRVSRKITGEFLYQLFLQSDQIRKEFAIGESRMFKGLRQRRLHLKSSRCEHGIVDISYTRQLGSNQRTLRTAFRLFATLHDSLLSCLCLDSSPRRCATCPA
jgi:hypothetical protein